MNKIPRKKRNSANAKTDFRYRNGIVLGYINEVFKPSLCRYNARSEMTLGISLRKINTVQKSLSFLGPKIWSKINRVIKNLKSSAI